MVEPKPLASLTSGLLARKGAAQPAMRRPMLGFGRTAGSTALQDDLGWNDMGFEDMGFDVTQPEPIPEDLRSVVGLTPMTAAPVSAPIPAVVTAREELAERIAAEVPAPQPASKPKKASKSKLASPASPKSSALSKGRKAAFTLRLDADRHLKLRLASAVGRRSAQQIVTEALDSYLNGLPEIARMAQHLPHRGED